nr:MAG TPA: hypothetical protein [Caudoviricetes sp.]
MQNPGRPARLRPRERRPLPRRHPLSNTFFIHNERGTHMKEIDNSENIILGSGDLYIVEFNDTVPEDATIEIDDNRAGNIKGGATLEYTATSQTVKDDKGRVSKTIVTEEDVKLKTGLITWSPAYLQALIETARVTETGKSGQHKHRTYKLGGLANKTGKRYLYRFVHTRDDGRKLRITVTGKNSGTISIAFQNDNPTQVDAEVTAQSLDSDGTLVIMDDELTENAT